MKTNSNGIKHLTLVSGRTDNHRLYMGIIPCRASVGLKLASKEKTLKCAWRNFRHEQPKAKGIPSIIA